MRLFLAPVALPPLFWNIGLKKTKNLFFSRKKTISISFFCFVFFLFEWKINWIFLKNIHSLVLIPTKELVFFFLILMKIGLIFHRFCQFQQKSFKKDKTLHKTKIKFHYFLSCFLSFSLFRIFMIQWFEQRQKNFCFRKKIILISVESI